MFIFINMNEIEILVENIKKLYLEEDKPYAKVCKILGISKGRFERLAKQYDIKKVRRYKSKLENPTSEELEKLEIIKDLYVNKKLSIKNISKITGFSKEAIKRRIRKFQLEKELTFEDRIKQKGEITISKEELIDLYVKQKISMKDIGNKFNCSKNKIRNLLTLYDIPIDTDIEDIKEKRYLSLKRNHSFNTSKPEEEIYEILLTKFPKTKNQYRSTEYPWPCDFYVPEIDTYIEINFHWTHGEEPFNAKKKAHRQLIEKWDKKSKELDFKGELKIQFAYAIKNWTKSDPLKRKTAKENNLNYLEFFNIKDFMEWFNSK